MFARFAPIAFALFFGFLIAAPWFAQAMNALHTVAATLAVAQ